MTAPDLKPCPNCTSTLGPFVGTPDGPRQVICSTCGMRGPYQNLAASSEDKWNALARTTPLAEALVSKEAATAREVFEDYGSKAKEAIDYMEQLLLAALRAIGERADG